MPAILNIRIFLFITLLPQESSTIKPPCSLRGAGIFCINDEDCDGPHSLCWKSVCSCPLNFEQYTLDAQTRVCRPARSKVSDQCQTECRPPLLCQNGTCVCWKAEIVRGQCVVNCPVGQVLVNQQCRPASNIGGRCQLDSDCVFPFTYCKNGICDCVPGSVKRNGACMAACPDGSPLGPICRKTFLNDPNVYINSDKMDTCQKGWQCVTNGKPAVGHCCPLYCPYGNPDLSKSCKLGAPINSKCPEWSTHYCQDFETKGAVDRLCCPRPCPPTTPLFLDGHCVPLGHWGDPCIKSEQCEGGMAMNCIDDRCRCKANFVQRNFTFPTCVPDCGLKGVAVSGHCQPKVNVGEPCVHNGQCPLNGHCREGICECDCGYVIRNGACSNPDDPLGFSTLLKEFQQLLEGGGRRGK